MSEVSSFLIKELRKKSKKKHNIEKKNIEKHYKTLKRFSEMFVGDAALPTKTDVFSLLGNMYRVGYVTFAMMSGTIIVTLNLYLNPVSGDIEKVSYLYIDEKNRINLGKTRQISDLSLLNNRKITKVLNVSDLKNKEIYIINEDMIVKTASSLLSDKTFFIPFKAQRKTYYFFEGIF